MDPEVFVRWTLDDARTLEERYTTELLVEECIPTWRWRHKIYRQDPYDACIERKRQRALNPAYQPTYSEESLRRTAEVLPELKSWNHYCGYDERPVRDLKVFRFAPAIEDFRLMRAELVDLSPLFDLPRLRKLSFSSMLCEDLGQLGRLHQLRALSLDLERNWPALAGLEKLAQLETISLKGNLLAFPPGISWPNVRCGSLLCEPLAARNVHDLPQLPAVEFLTLNGVERLDGIAAFTRLRNLTLEARVRDFAPLADLPHLTSFICHADEPRDVSPLVRVPRLTFISFDLGHKRRVVPIAPRDLSPLTDCPHLRTLHVGEGDPLTSEAAAINAGLPSWEDQLLAETPRVLPPLKFAIAPWKHHPPRPAPVPEPGEFDLPDVGLCQCQGAWLSRYLTRVVSEGLDDPDWGEVGADAASRSFHATVESYGVVERFAEIVHWFRVAMTRLRREYHGQIMICLKVPPLKATPAQQEMERKFRDAQEQAEWENRRREREEYLQRLHRYELKKQEGMTIKPEEFAPGDALPLPPPPWESDSEDEDDADGEGDVAVKEKPDPPPSYDDGEHPLADNYRLMVHLSLAEAWFAPHHRDLAIYLMRRQPDLDIPDEKEEK
ncbi:MAG: hypothetical protein FD161_1434 [Limisphaerales bacterium]|nr:MAG: hypothetical protein FD161_1434 [Limisphaerales bacterium]KAG0509511.1 MAG: hypothetical protein E1N63_1353 [Limisphaerales bacterium]TXT52347.1 MAG: hypothetical protein FD140_834 [Limisphaerales bacterium]